MSQSPGAQLRSLLDRGSVIAPGAFNALVARCVALAGFDAVYISGGATANVAGYPDTGLITLTEMCRTIREISQASGLPTIVDADTGYGGTESVIRTVVEYSRNGAAALHLEDQVFPKRCGHLDGKQLISTSDMCDKIAAAVQHPPDPDMVIIARTDAAGVDGFDAAVDRANEYRAAGADMIFPEGLQTEDEFTRMAHSSPGWLLANMTEFGKTPQINATRFHEMGYQVVIYPLSMMRLAMGHIERGLKLLREQGAVEPLLDEMQSRTRLYETLDYSPDAPWNFPGRSGREVRKKTN